MAKLGNPLEISWKCTENGVPGWGLSFLDKTQTDLLSYALREKITRVSNQV